MRKAVILITCLMGMSLLYAQQTVGLFQYDAGSREGYTLFAPMASYNTYLIDNCGREVHSWPGNYYPGLSVYLLEDGRLLRTCRVTSSVFSGGGTGGRVELRDWNGNLEWGYTYSNDTVHQHHDVEYLPSGNILILAWEKKTTAQAIAAGRIPSAATNDVWAEQITEVQPIGTDSAVIVWQWRLWDHLIQDYDSTKANYGVVSDHPELMNLNFYNGNGSNSDWIHANSVAYNAELDQIALSSHNSDEVWIIDHSTSTAQAATHSGGNSGKGGDLLYRWGNPQAYDRGTAGDQQLFGQHDAHWIPSGYPGVGQIILYNNGTGRPGGNYSTVDVIETPVDSAGNYSLGIGAYGPASPAWTYQAAVPTDFFSSAISGAQRLDNGNTLICEGQSGNFFEVDSSGNTVWLYVNPIGQSGPVSQGGMPMNNNCFRVRRYNPDYAGFNGQSLVPGDRIELNPLPLPANCDTLSARDETGLSGVSFSPNPFTDHIDIEFEQVGERSISIYNSAGQQVLQYDGKDRFVRLESLSLPRGMYLLEVRGATSGYEKLLKIH